MFAGSELGSLSTESRRKFADVREAADRAQALIKTPDEALRDLHRAGEAITLTRSAEDGPNAVILSPILQGCQTKNAKIIVLAVACLQRLVAIRGTVTRYSVSAILQNLRAVLNQGVEVQLKILQTLVALLTNCKDIHGSTLAEALLLCFKLQDSKIGVVSSTAAATLRQLVMIVFEGVVEEDGGSDTTSQTSVVALPDGTTMDLRPSAQDAYHVFEDLCILVGSPETSTSLAYQPQFLKLTHLPKTFGLELIESVLADFVRVFLRHAELLSLLRALLAPLVLRGLSERPSPFSNMTRFMRIGFLLMKQYHVPLDTELEVFVHLFVRIVDGSGTQGTEENWTRVLALEVLRGICNDFELLLKLWRNFRDVLLAALTALGKVATEKPALLGSTGTAATPSSLVLPGGIAGDAVNSVLEMAAHAATSVGVLPNSTGSAAGLAIETSSMKLQCIDQLDKAEPPVIPETYPYLLSLHCLTAVANASYAFVVERYVKVYPASSTPPPAIRFESGAPEPIPTLLTVNEMVNAAWPALLSSLTFFLSTNLDDTLFDNTLTAHQAMAKTCGMLNLPVSRDAFLTLLCRLTVPASGNVEASTLSERNIECLRAVVAVAASLAGSLGTSWLLVFECLQHAEVSLRRPTSEASLLFEKTRQLDEPAFASFVGSLCRLNGEVIGMPVTESGALDLDAGQGSAARPSTRRRGSTIAVKRTLKAGEKTVFGITRLDEVAILNIERLTATNSDAWNIIVSHLLAVTHWSAAPPPIRLQAALVLDHLLETALKKAGDSIQTRVLEALSDQSEAELGPQSSTDIEIRRMGLDALFHMLESTGHSLTGGWPTIFGILTSACPGRLVKVAFPVLQLVCTDFLTSLDVDDLQLCITALATFGRQEDDINIALTAGGLLWQVSDHLQSRKHTIPSETAAYADLWMLLLHKLLFLSEGDRQEVRDGAIQIIFRNLELHGNSLSINEWKSCLWDIVMPLLDALDASIRTLPAETVSTSPAKSTMSMAEVIAQPQPGLRAKQWDDSKILALSSVCNVVADHIEAVQGMTNFEETWSTLVTRCKVAFNNDRSQVAVAAMRAFDRLVGVCPSVPLREVAWRTWEEAGADIVAGGKQTVYTQGSLEAYVLGMPKPIAPKREKRLLELLEGVLLYTRCPDSTQDVDSPNAVQQAVLGAVKYIPLTEAVNVAALLNAYASYCTLAFRRVPSSMLTYVGLFKAIVPKASALLASHVTLPLIFVSGAAAGFLQCLATPMRLKYACPPANKYGDDPPLWKMANTQFLASVPLCVTRLGSAGRDIPDDVFVTLYQSILLGCTSALLADSQPMLLEPAELQEEDNMIDLRILHIIEDEMLPHLADTRLPDSLLADLGATLASASILYRLDLLSETTPPRSPSGSEAEARFSSNFFVQARPNVFGTTAGIIESPKEKVAYWSWDLLFKLCHATPATTPTQRRIASLVLPSLLSRCEACLRTYLVDRSMYGRMPFPRIREEEVIYVLEKLLTLRVDGDAFAAAHRSTLNTKSAEFRGASVAQSPVAHLFGLHNLLVSLVALPRPSVAFPPVILSPDAVHDAHDDSSQANGITLEPRRISGSLQDLAKLCLYEVGQALVQDIP